MKYIRARLYLLFSLTILILAALASFGAQAQEGTDTSGEASITWTAHSGFGDDTLRIWYNVRYQPVAESRLSPWEHLNTQALTITVTGLTVGTKYRYTVSALGCTAIEAASIEKDTLSPSCMYEAVVAADTFTAVSSTSSGCTLAYDGPGGQGEITVSWAAHPPDSQNPGATIWYCVHSQFESKATSKTSATFTGLLQGEEYGWHVDAFSCAGGESIANGTCSRITGDSIHAFGSAVASGSPQRVTDGSSDSSGSSNSSSSGSSDSSNSSSSGSSDSSGSSSSSSKRDSSAPSAPPPEAYLDHSVTVGGNANFQPLTGSGIGNAQVIAQVVISATDVWGHVPAGTRVCFVGRIGGGVMFLDAATMPRALAWLPHSIHGYDTCAQLPGAGTVALVMGAGPYAAAAPASAAEEDPPQPENTATQPICQIKLTQTLFLRSEPAVGQIIGLVWLNSEVPVYEIEGGWYLIEFEGQFGYIIGSHRKLLWGSC